MSGGLIPLLTGDKPTTTGQGIQRFRLQGEEELFQLGGLAVLVPKSYTGEKGLSIEVARSDLFEGHSRIGLSLGILNDLRKPNSSESGPSERLPRSGDSVTVASICPGVTGD